MGGARGDPNTVDDLRAMTARQRASVLAAADRQLMHEPTAETRNRNSMRPNPLALGSFGSEGFASTMMWRRNRTEGSGAIASFEPGIYEVVETYSPANA